MHTDITYRITDGNTYQIMLEYKWRLWIPSGICATRNEVNFVEVANCSTLSTDIPRGDLRRSTLVKQLKLSYR